MLATYNHEQGCVCIHMATKMRKDKSPYLLHCAQQIRHFIATRIIETFDLSNCLL